MHGLHLLADLGGCAPDQPWMQDEAALADACLTLVADHGLRQVGQLFHRFTPRDAMQPSGVTGVLLLAESHLSVHTWPELGRVTLDLFVCNQTGDHRAAAQAVMDALVAGFAPQRVTRQALQRGEG